MQWIYCLKSSIKVVRTFREEKSLSCDNDFLFDSNMSGSDYFFTNSYDSRRILVAHILRLSLLYGKINIMISSLSDKLKVMWTEAMLSLTKAFTQTWSSWVLHETVIVLSDLLCATLASLVSATSPPFAPDFHLGFHFHFRRNACVKFIWTSKQMSSYCTFVHREGLEKVTARNVEGTKHENQRLRNHDDLYCDWFSKN